MSLKDNVYAKTTRSAFGNAGSSIDMTRGLIDSAGEAVGYAERGGRRPFLLRHGLSLEAVRWYRKMSINTALMMAVPAFGLGMPYALSVSMHHFPVGIFLVMCADIVIGTLGVLAWMQETNMEIAAAKQLVRVPMRGEG